MRSERLAKERSFAWLRCESSKSVQGISGWFAFDMYFGYAYRLPRKQEESMTLVKVLVPSKKPFLYNVICDSSSMLLDPLALGKIQP
jgi:hypothetical protein